jgi:hypothetical protein
MLSIVNPIVERNGASTVTRGLLKLLASPPLKADVDCIPVRRQPSGWHRLMQIRSLTHSRFSNLPAKAAFVCSTEFRERVIARIRSADYDLIILNGADLLWISDYLPKSIPRLLVAHNIEHRLFAGLVKSIGRSCWPLEKLLCVEGERLKDYELNGMRETRNVMFLSQEEAGYAQSLCEGLRLTTVPPVFDYEPAIRKPRRQGAVLELGLLGNFCWWPNQLGLRWFVREVLPNLKSPVRLNLFGRPGSRRWRGDPRIREHGMVERIQQVWETCDLMICPVFSSAGVCVKLAEAVYNGVPVLATNLAARGLPIDKDSALVFLDGSREWVDFLNSTAAWQLTQRQVSEKTKAPFSVGAQKAMLHQFVHDAILASSVAGSRSG